MGKRVLIIGAGEAGRMLGHEIAADPTGTLSVIGFLDDDGALRGASVDGHPVFGRSVDLADVVSRESIDEVIVAVPSGGRDVVRRMVVLCRDAGVPFKIVPGLLEIVKGPVRLEQIRDIRPEDLLGRESVEFDEGAVSAALAGRRVLVTGAGGSIGSEICRQVGRFDLAGLFLLGRGENQIFNIEQDLRERLPALRVTPLIADIRDGGSLAHLFRDVRPEFVFHAAAHKHVHYMEAFPCEAVRNNIIGTSNVIDSACDCGARRVVMLSTDKAVNPRGVMGATKRFAEYLMMSRTVSRRDCTTRLTTVRFGNVLASRGSVVPLFMRQIARGGPVTVSDRRATRFFMSIREACLLVVQASILGQGGEIFILKMGQPIRIEEIAKDLIAMHGLRPDCDVPIEFVGLRPGEKLHEDLVAPGEKAVDSAHPGILSHRGKPPEGLDVEAALAELRLLCERNEDDGVRRGLAKWIPDGALEMPNGETGGEGSMA